MQLRCLAGRDAKGSINTNSRKTHCYCHGAYWELERTTDSRVSWDWYRTTDGNPRLAIESLHTFMHDFCEGSELPKQAGRHWKEMPRATQKNWPVQNKSRLLMIGMANALYKADLLYMMLATSPTRACWQQTPAAPQIKHLWRRSFWRSPGYWQRGVW